MIDIDNWDEKIKKNAYSVVSYNEKTWKLVLLIKYTWWVWTSWLWTKKSWDEITTYPPLWHFSIKWKKDNLVFFATGIGLPPFVCMLNDLFYGNSYFTFGPLAIPTSSSAIPTKAKMQKKITLFFWVREKEDLYYLDFLEKLKKENSNFSYEICLSRENWHGFNWYITDHPLLNSIDFKNAEVYYCWSKIVSKSLKKKVISLGLDKKLFSSEAF